MYTWLWDETSQPVDVLLLNTYSWSNLLSHCSVWQISDPIRVCVFTRWLMCRDDLYHSLRARGRSLPFNDLCRACALPCCYVRSRTNIYIYIYRFRFLVYIIQGSLRLAPNYTLWTSYGTTDVILALSRYLRTPYTFPDIFSTLCGTLYRRNIKILNK